LDWINTSYEVITGAKCWDVGIIMVTNYDPPGNYMRENAY